MSIILNEYEWAEKAIAAHELGNKPSETLARVAKYYYKNMYTKSEVRNLLDDFMLRCDPSVSLQSWAGTLDYIAKNSAKYPIVQIENIPITSVELETIQALDSKPLRRLAFTLLCIAKYQNAVSPIFNGWVNTPDKEIMSMANVNTSVKRQCAMFAALRDAGLIAFSKKIDNTKVQVLFISEGETVMEITDFRNIGFQYLMHCGEPYYECVNCGLVTKTNTATRGRKQKYCPTCAVELHTKQKIASVMRKRNEDKIDS